MTETIEIQDFINPKGLNLIQFAASDGNSEVVKFLLNLSSNKDSIIGNLNEHSLPWNQSHSDVLLTFAKSDLPYPDGVDVNDLSEDFKIFYKTTEELHQAIMDLDKQKVEAIIRDNPYKLKYFFNLQNESAAKVAIDHHALDIYETLISHDVLISPQEISKDVFETLEYSIKKNMRELHTKHSKDHPDNHINILMANSYSAHDGGNVKKNLDRVKLVYIKLSKDPFCNGILRVVAASKRIEFHYDFERDNVSIIDPTNSSYTEGVYYPKGKIYIGAKFLCDDSENENLAIAVIGHELCHCAMMLVFGNHAKPYFRNDQLAKQEFERINQICCNKCNNEEIVSLVYECYPESLHHAELVVRGPHMTWVYYDQPDILQQKQDTFKELFAYNINYVLPEMVKAVPQIKKREKLEQEQKDKKISQLRRNFFISVGASIIGLTLLAILAYFMLYKPNYKFESLSDKLKDNVRNGIVSFKNVDVKLLDLFPKNSSAYNSLTSDQISQILNNDQPSFSDPSFLYLNTLVFLTWSNLTQKLQDKLLSSNFSFQNESLSFEKVKQIAPDSLNFLNSEQIITTLDCKRIYIGSIIQNDTAFYVERKFTLKFDVLDLRTLYEKHKHNYQFYLKQEESVKSYYLDNLTTNKSLDGSKLHVKQEYPHIIISSIENMSDVLKKIFVTRFLILSDEAGTGKTFTFEQIAIRLKREHPTKWVSYIDLKDFTRFYNASGFVGNVDQLLENILNLGTENEFEMEIFKAQFRSGQVILLWNGFDEISPIFSEFIENVMLNIYNNSTNIQFVCTRPLYADQLEDLFNVSSHGLLPFTVREQKEFIEKYFHSENVSLSEIDKYVDKVYQIAAKQQFTTPLMLKMMVEVHEDIELFSLQNIYEIYESFIGKKVDIWQAKSSFARELTKYFLSGRKLFNIMKIYQKFALLSEFFLNKNVKNLQIMKTEIPKALPLHEITRMGILYINSEDEFEFAHKTFAEFFVAQFIIENIYQLENSTEFDENILDIFQYLNKNEVVANFIINFLYNQKEKKLFSFRSDIKQLLVTKYNNTFVNMMYLGTHTVFEMLFKLFGMDKDILKSMLRVNETVTLYAMSYDPIYFARDIDPNYIKFLAQNSLSKEDYSNFIAGKNQKGKILYGITVYEVLLKLPRIHSEYTLGTDKLDHDFMMNFYERIEKNLTGPERKELLLYLIENPRLLFLHSTYEFHHYGNLWKFAESILSENEKKKALGNALGKCNELFNYDFIYIYLNLSEFLLNECAERLTDSEIYNTFMSQKILQKSLIYHDMFEQLWSFFVEHTTYSQRREILMERITYNRIDTAVGNGGFNFYQDFVPFTILEYSMFSRVPFGSFPTVSKLYKDYFNNTEIQRLISESNTFMVYMIAYTNNDTWQLIVEFIKKIFEGNEEKLHDLLTRKINGTDYSVFDYFGGLRLSVKNATDLFRKLIN